MRFEAHGCDTNQFVSHKIKNMSHKMICGSWVSHKRDGQPRVVPTAPFKEVIKRVHEAAM